MIQLYPSLGMSNILMLRVLAWSQVNLDSHIGWCEIDLGSKFPQRQVLLRAFYLKQVPCFCRNSFLPSLTSLAWGWGADRRRFRSISRKEIESDVWSNVGRKVWVVPLSRLGRFGERPMAKVGWYRLGKTRKIKWCAKFFWGDGAMDGTISTSKTIIY